MNKQIKMLFKVWVTPEHCVTSRSIETLPLASPREAVAPSNKAVLITK